MNTQTLTPRRFERPAITDPQQLLFGQAPQPVQCGLGVALGAGQVHPELNFTLPPMLINAGTWAQVRDVYTGVITRVIERCRMLNLASLVIEFEQLPPMTENPAWGAELTRLLKDHLQQAHVSWGLKSALRVTIVDLRDAGKPPQRRGGAMWERMQQALHLSSQAGADILSIESTGGKELHDPALVHADVPGIVYALGVLAPADMAWLWDRFVEVAREYRIIAGGDTACGFANTAMQLAGQNMLPDVLAALVRALCCVRSVVAYERGAVGPSKDCAYEGPVMKAIAGVPIAMEGRSATCAHLSPLGNIAGAMADLWSNESVADVRLLSGPAPIASLESLIYDCRLFNAATTSGSQRTLRDLHVQSDAPHSAQAWLMTPEATIALAQAITAQRDPYHRTLAAGRVALQLVAEGVAGGGLKLAAREKKWLDRLRSAFDQLPADPGALHAQVAPKYEAVFDPQAYTAA